MVLMAAFAVDLGMQRVVRSDMQALADVVALDAARLLDGRTAGEIRAGTDGLGSLTSVVQESVDRNTSTLGDVDGVEAVLVTLVPGPRGTVVPKSDADGTPIPVASGSVPDAVLIRSTGSVDFAFRAGVGAATRTAVAEAVTAGCFRLGSFAAAVQPANAEFFESVLGPLLGQSTIKAAGYEGLANVDLTLLDILSASPLDVGTVDGLLEDSEVRLGDLYLATAQVLNNRGDALSAEVLSLAALSVVASEPVDLLKLVALSTAQDSALTTEVNVLDLLLGSAFLANGENLLNLSPLQASLGAVGVTTTSLKIIERAQMACNDDVAETAQVRLTADAKVNLAIPVIKTPVVDLGLVDETGQPDGTLNMRLEAVVADAQGQLTDLQCNPDVFTIDVDTRAATLRLNGGARLKGEVKLALEVLGVSAEVSLPVSLDFSVFADASKSLNDTLAPAVISIPPGSYDQPTSVDSTSSLLPNVTVAIDADRLSIGDAVVTVKIAGAKVDVKVKGSDYAGAVLSAVSGVAGTLTSVVSARVNPLVNKVNGDVLGPLLAGMGVRVAGADVYALPTPQCNSPRLRG